MGVCGSWCGRGLRGRRRRVRRAGCRRGGYTAITGGRWQISRSTGGGWWSVCGYGVGCAPHSAAPDLREQVPECSIDTNARTARLTRHVRSTVKELAGRAGARFLPLLSINLSRHTALRTLVRIPLPTGRAPRVIGVDDFALKRRHRYATVVIDAETHERIDVLPDRIADTLAAWLSEHPDIEVVCRDGSATYAEAIRRALPDAVQVADRWHLWHVRREALIDRVEVGDLRRRPVAAGW